MLLAVATAIVVNLLTDRWVPALWIALGVLVALTAAVQLGLTTRVARQVSASGPASVAVGGTVRGPISTRSWSDTEQSEPIPPADADIWAGGSGSVAVGEDVHGQIDTDGKRSSEVNRQ